MPGLSCLIGAGGIGRAFALLDPDLRDLRLVDRDVAKADAFAGV